MLRAKDAKPDSGVRVFIKLTVSGFHHIIVVTGDDLRRVLSEVNREIEIAINLKQPSE